MKKILFASLCALLLTGCTSGTLKTSAPAAITVTTKTIQEKTASGDIDISYPELGGLPAEKAQAVNTAIGVLVQKERDNFKEWDMPLPGRPAYRNDFRLDFQPYLINEHVASVLFTEYYFTGGAHGTQVYIPFLYDLDKKAAVSISDLFQKDSNFLEQLSVATLTELKTQHPDWDQKWLKTGTAPDLKNFDAVALAQDELTIAFQDYQVGPHAVGMPTITIPLHRLEKILDIEQAQRWGLVMAAQK